MTLGYVDFKMLVSDDQTGCKPCNRGWFHNTKSLKCEVCPDGQTTELHGQTQCTLITGEILLIIISNCKNYVKISALVTRQKKITYHQ